MNRLQEHYNNVIRKDFLVKFNYKNNMEIPKISKIVLNISLKDAIRDKKNLIPAMLTLELITGQKPIITKAKKSVSTFKLRQGMSLGCKVTLRNQKMYNFLDNLVTMTLPRIRDFQGFSLKSFDGKGNFTFGIKDFLIFPEIEAEYNKFDSIFGMDITIVTTAKTDLEAKMLLSAFQVPFFKN